MFYINGLSALWEGGRKRTFTVWCCQAGTGEETCFLNGSHQEKGFSHLTVHSVHP